MLTLESLGWRRSHLVWFQETGRGALRPARVAMVHGGVVSLLGLYPEDPLRPELGQVKVRSEGALDALAVGDWVACFEEAGRWSVAAQLPRSSCFVRKAKGRASLPQLVAANVDRVLVVTAIGGDLSPRRLERYLAQVWASGAEPIIVINKIDRPHDPEAALREVASVACGVPVAWVSAHEAGGLEQLAPLLQKGDTVALVGSSGVGKSSLVNRLLGDVRFATDDVRAHDDTGTHTTTRRELVLAPAGFLLIDTPGMRELGLIDAESGLEVAFADLEQVATDCRFRDCRHEREPGCAVRAAVERGVLPRARLASYLRLRDELARNRERVAERSDEDTKRRWRSIHKGVRQRRKLHGKLGLKDD